MATHPPPCPLPTPLGGQNIYGGKQGMPIPSVVAREGRAGRSPFGLPLVASGHYEQVGRRPRTRPARYRISIHARSIGGGYLSAQQPERTARTQMSNHETIQHSYTQTCIRSLSRAATRHTCDYYRAPKHRYKQTTHCHGCWSATKAHCYASACSHFGWWVLVRANNAKKNHR